MTKRKWAFGAMVLLGVPGLGWGQAGKMDPFLHMQWLRSRQESAAARLHKKAAQEVTVIASGRVSADGLAERGGRVRWQRGEFAILSVAPEHLPGLAQTPGLISLVSLTRAKPATAISIPEMGGIAARSSSGLTGSNVLIGVVDSGIDWSHEDFKTPEGKTRIKAILDLSVAGEYYGGSLFTEEQINAALAGGWTLEAHDYSGHGTHVAGIAAGDGGDGASLGSFAGMAPEAGLVIVKASRDPLVSEFSNDDQMIAIDFIDSVATALGLPCVINLSFGTNYGAHDGTSSVERYIDSISGPGRVVVAAAGNEGDKKHHSLVNPAAGNANVSFTISPYQPKPASDDDYLLLNGWYDGGSQVTVTLITPANETFGPVAYGRYQDGNSSSGYIRIWNGFYESDGEVISGRNPFNRDKEIIIEISDDAGMAPASGQWQLKFTGSSKSLDMWIASESMSVQFDRGVSEKTTVTAPATGKSVIAVGAYTTRESWTDLDGNNLTLDTKGTIKTGDIAEFSGAGPSRDGRTKPEITAPGRIIGSSLSLEAGPLTSASVFASSNGSYPNAFILPDGVHGLSLGTSTSAPHVSGTIALLLQRDPALSAAQVKQTIIATARKVNTGAKAHQWGNGKLNAAAAVAVDPGSLPEEQDPLFLPRPNPFIVSTAIIDTLAVTSTGLKSPEVHLYNALGQRVPALLYREPISSRYEAVRWYGQTISQQRVAAGVYFVVFIYNNRRITRKVCLLQN